MLSKIASWKAIIAVSEPLPLSSRFVLNPLMDRSPPVGENVASSVRTSAAPPGNWAIQPMSVTPAGNVIVKSASSPPETLLPCQLRTRMDWTLVSTPPGDDTPTPVLLYTGMPVRSTVGTQVSTWIMKAPVALESGAASRIGKLLHCAGVAPGSSAAPSQSLSIPSQASTTPGLTAALLSSQSPPAVV